MKVFNENLRKKAYLHDEMDQKVESQFLKNKSIDPVEQEKSKNQQVFLTQDSKLEFNILKAESRQNKSLEDTTSHQDFSPRKGKNFSSNLWFETVEKQQHEKSMKLLDQIEQKTQEARQRSYF